MAVLRLFRGQVVGSPQYTFVEFPSEIFFTVEILSESQIQNLYG